MREERREGKRKTERREERTDRERHRRVDEERNGLQNVRKEKRKVGRMERGNKRGINRVTAREEN